MTPRPPGCRRAAASPRRWARPLPFPPASELPVRLWRLAARCALPCSGARQLARGLHSHIPWRRCLTCAPPCSLLHASRGHGTSSGTSSGTLPQRQGLRGWRDGQAQEGGAHHWHHGPGECEAGPSRACCRRARVHLALAGAARVPGTVSWAVRKAGAAREVADRCGCGSVLTALSVSGLPGVWERVSCTGCGPHTGARRPSHLSTGHGSPCLYKPSRMHLDFSSLQTGP